MPALTPIELLTPRLKLRWMNEGDVDARFALFSGPAVAARPPFIGPTSRSPHRFTASSAGPGHAGGAGVQ